MGTLKEFTKPNFLLCELPIKHGTAEDDRVWIYAVNHLTLIECILMNDKDLYLNTKYKVFEYGEERWALAFVQNNIEATDGEEDKVLNEAWQFFSDYLKWEDDNINKGLTSKLN